jgi:alkylhydroperoxidase family enzyme
MRRNSRRFGTTRQAPVHRCREAALDVAVAAGCVPNAVTDELFAELHKHWTEEQIVEIVAVISYFGFLNRWNDTLATPLEEEPLHFGEEYLASHGWSAGKHRA